MLFMSDKFAKPSQLLFSLGRRLWQITPLTGFKSDCFLIVISVFSTILLNILATPEAIAFETFRIGTGGSSGVYYPIGKIIATGLTIAAEDNASALHGLIGVAQNSAGSIENVRAIVNGELEAGLVQADIAAFAYKGERDFTNLKNSNNVRAIASLYSEKFQLVVRKDAGVSNISELKGKRISVDEVGSGTKAIMDIVLEAYGLSENDLLPLFLKPAFTEDKIRNGQLQGFALMAGVPSIAVSKLADTGVTLLPIDQEIALNICRQYKYLTPGKIAESIYPGIPETSTVEVYALLVVNESMSNEVAYALTEALFSDKTNKLLNDGHPIGKAIGLNSALTGVSIPLHPGAMHYYSDHKVATRESL
jgi:uncharacterized protein